MRSKWPLIKLVKTTALGSVLAAAGGVLCMLFQVIQHGRLTGSISHRLIVASLTIVPWLPGTVIALIAPHRIKVGLRAKRWPMEEIRLACDWLESPTIKRMERWWTRLMWPLLIGWLVYCAASIARNIHPHPNAITAIFIIVPLGWLSVLRKDLRAELPSEVTPTLWSAKPLRSEHWGQREA